MVSDPDIGLRVCRRHAPSAGGLSRLALIAVLACTAWAAEAARASTQPVAARVLAGPVAAAVGRTATVRLEVRVADGWHINGDKPRQEFLIATRLSLELPEGMRAGAVRYPEPVLRKLPFAGDAELALFEGTSVFEAELMADRAFGAEANAVAVLGYQACTDTLCKPPTDLRVLFRIVAGSEPAEAPEADAEPTPSDPRADEEASDDARQQADDDAAVGRAAIRWEPFNSESYLAARASGEPFVLEFTADWCGPCREMAARTFTDPAVLKAAEGARFLSIDLTRKSAETWSLRKGFNAPGAPTLIFFAPGGREHTRRLGFVGPDDFARLIEEARRDDAPASPATGESQSNSKS